MNTLADWVCRYPRGIVIGILLASAYLTTGLTFSQSRPVLDGELPESDPIVRETNHFKKNHPDRNFYLIGIVADGAEGVWNPGTLEKIRALSEEVTSLPGALPNVQSLATWKHVSSAGDLVTIESLLPAALGPKEIANLRNLVRGDPLLSGRLVSTDDRMALVRITLRDDADEAAVYKGIEALIARHAGPERVFAFGRHYINHAIALGANRHASVLLPIAILVMLVFFYLCFGQWQAVWTGGMVMTLSAIAFLGTMGVLGIPQSPLTSAIPVLLIVAVDSYVVHLLARAYEEHAHRSWPEAIRVAIVTSGRAVGYAMVTTVVGFASLLAFQIYSVQEFGVLAAAGIAIASVIAVTFLPAVLLLVGPPVTLERQWGRGTFLRWTSAVTRLAQRVAMPGKTRTLASWLAISGAVLATLSLLRIQIGSNPPEFFPSEHPVHQASTAFLQHFEADAFISIGIEAPAGTDIYEPAFMRRVRDLQLAAPSVAGVSYATSVVDTVIERMHAVMNPDERRDPLDSASRELIVQYLELYRWDAPDTLAEMIGHEYPARSLVVEIFVNANDAARVSEIVTGIRAALSRTFPDGDHGVARLGGEWVLWVAQNRYLVLGKIFSIVGSTWVIFLVGMFAFRRADLALLSIVPSAYAALLVFGVMPVLDIPLDLASCSITVIVIGVGVDFAFHFLLRYLEVAAASPQAPHRELIAQVVPLSARPILYDALSNCIAFSVLMASDLLPVRRFGMLLAVSMLACLWATVMILPGLMVIVQDRRTRLVPTSSLRLSP